MNKPTTTARGIFSLTRLNPRASGRPDSKEEIRPEMESLINLATEKIQSYKFDSKLFPN